MAIIDTHCHLDFEAFDDDREQVLQRASDAGVDAMILIGTNPITWKSTAALAASQPQFVRAVGMHPTSVNEHWTNDTISALRNELDAPDIVAVGEIGLDFFRESEFRTVQIEAFEAQLDLAREQQRPIVIHQRSAEQETLEILRRFRPLTGVMHCFSSDTVYAHACLDLGFYLGIGGIATFKNADGVRQTIRSVPLDRIVIETDAPFLSPQRWRGKRNEPSYLTNVIEVLAEIYAEPPFEIVSQTTRNAIDLFGAKLALAAGDGRTK